MHICASVIMLPQVVFITDNRNHIQRILVLLRLQHKITRKIILFENVNDVEGLRFLENKYLSNFDGVKEKFLYGFEKPFKVHR